MRGLLVSLLAAVACAGCASEPGVRSGYNANAWRVVGKWHRESSGKTALFSVPQEWRIVYNCPPAGTVISVYDTDGKCRDVVTAKGIGVSYEHGTAGRMYLDFQPGYPPGPYSVQVQALDR